jgi:hypothetical protein
MCFRPAAMEIEKKCTECGTYNPPANEICSKCGAALPENKVGGAPGGAPMTPPSGKPNLPPRPPMTPKKPG